MWSDDVSLELGNAAKRSTQFEILNPKCTSCIGTVRVYILQLISITTKANRVTNLLTRLALGSYKRNHNPVNLTTRVELEVGAYENEVLIHRLLGSLTGILISSPFLFNAPIRSYRYFINRVNSGLAHL